MRQSLIVLTALAAAAAVFAEPSGDRPDATHAWAVHDVNRPDPVKIEVPENGVPSDALVLFDGTAESVARNWRAADGTPTKWTVKDGAFIASPGSGSALTRADFGDCQLHVEWKTPVDDVEGFGNSGVYLMNAYEIQILDSSAIVPSRSPWKPANYADGQAGAVYGQSPALVNPCRKPGIWQSYDIVFHPPRYENGQLIDEGDITVFFNGVLVQDAWKLQGKTDWCRRAKVHPVGLMTGPVKLQDHGHPVAFRNIWIRKLPPRGADSVSGGPFAKTEDVAALRHQLAGESLAFAKEATDATERLIRLWESYAYEPDPKVKAQIPSAEKDVLADLEKGVGLVANPRHFRALKRFLKMLVTNQLLPKDHPFFVSFESIQDPPKPAAANMRDY